ncbi:MAG: hypothetical protein ACJAT7_001066 [Psychromonas sp.]|jgi:hypothetical protein|uniref:PEP-CTERM sorting domain-containing protein n=1 Tax=Psychromonas sp. TaxID=1884585 RepID=UPI0039E5661C
MNKFIGLLTTSLLLLLATSTASAKLIDGTINFVGSATVSTNATEVTAMDFNGTKVSDFDSLVTGDFDGLEDNIAPFTDFVVGSPTPYAFWSVGGFTFTITSINTNTLASIGGINFAIIGGNGTITSTNPYLDETAGTWIVTANGVSDDMSFSSTAVPAPAGAALLGLGLLGFGFARRNKKA